MRKADRPIKGFAHPSSDHPTTPAPSSKYGCRSAGELADEIANVEPIYTTDYRVLIFSARS